MDERMNQLALSLGEELKLYRELIEVGEEERRILLGGDHQGLMGTAERKLALCTRLGEAQDARREIMRALAPAGEEPPRLKSLAHLLPPERREAYRAMVDQLAALAQRLAGLNQANKGFIEEALDMVETIMATLTTGGRPQGYGARGQGKVMGPSMPRMLAREV